MASYLLRIEHDAADADGEGHVLVAGEGSADVAAETGALLLAADGRRLEVDLAAPGALDAETDLLGGRSEELRPLEVEGAPLAAAGGGVLEVAEGRYVAGSASLLDGHGEAG